MIEEAGAPLLSRWVNMFGAFSFGIAIKRCATEAHSLMTDMENICRKVGLNLVGSFKYCRTMESVGLT